jgi:anti-sigma regulatory factor (Ser/Thr protein kinase)
VDALQNAQLVTSELVTNAVQHGSGTIVLRLSLRGDHLRIEVTDEGTGAKPAIREQTEGRVGGWGLRVVEALALRWGAHADTTHVWADLPLS